MKSRVKTRTCVGIAAALLAMSALPSRADGPFQFFSVTPCRLADTRGANGPSGGPALVGNQQRAFTVQGRCGVPVGAKAAVVNVTAVAPSAAGYLVLFASGTALPGTSNLNYAAGDAAIANGAIVALGGTSADLTIYAYASTHVVLDVTGYFR